jgi:hypothetical protein
MIYEERCTRSAEKGERRMNIVYSKRAVKAITRMDSDTKRRILRGISGIPEEVSLCP